MSDETAQNDAEAAQSPSLDMDPEAAAAEALDGGPAAAQAVETAGQGPTQTPFWARTEPNPPVEDIKGWDEWREYRSQYLQRGVMKMTGADDQMAIIDVLKGSIGYAVELAEEYDI